MKKGLISIFFFFLLCSCSPQNKVSKLIIENKVLSKEFCQEASCAEVFFSWPSIASGPHKEKINTEILNKLAVYASFEEEPGMDLNTAVESFLNEFRNFKNDFPDASSGWSIEVKAEVSFDSLGILSVIFQEYNYTGGAHPNSSKTFLNFDKLKGNLLSNQEIVSDEASLLKLVEDEFRSFHEIDENIEILEDDRFFIPESGFALARAIGYSGNHLLLIYNPYEIGPYVMGSTEIKIPLNRLKGIVRF